MPAPADPAYQAYLRALGFDETIARNDAELQKAQAVANAQLAKPELMAQGGEAREGISDSFEDRGMFLGTERLRGLANQRRTELYQLGLIDKGAADTVANVNMGLQRELHGISKERMNAQQQHQAYLDALAQEAAGSAGVGGSFSMTPPLGYNPTPIPRSGLRPAERRTASASRFG